MAGDGLLAVRKVRQRAVEQARQALAVCLTFEADVRGRIVALDEAQARDRAALRLIENAHQFHETFRLREQARQAERRSAEAALTAAQARSGEARAAVGVARSAAEAVETLISERAKAARVEADRRAQHELDDIARARLRAGPWAEWN